MAVLSCSALGAELPVATPESAGLSPARLTVMDRAIEAEVERGRIAGMVVAVARHGMLVHNRAYGDADSETGEAMTADHLFRLYSMTKPIASVALLTLYERGPFHLTDPLNRYIPGFGDLSVFAGFDGSGQGRTLGYPTCVFTT